MVVQLSEQALDTIVRRLPQADRNAAAELLDTGFSSVVVAFGSSVVRVARNDQAKEGHAREMVLLPWLDGRLSVDLPIPRVLLASSPALPFGAIVQPRLQGRAMTAEDGQSESLAAEFGHVLAQLHGLDYSIAPKGSLLQLDPVPYLQRIVQETETCLLGGLSSNELTRLDNLLHAAEATLPGPEQALCHGDAWYGNALIDEEGHVTALLDFEDACLADPALDLAATMHLCPPGPELVLDAYLNGGPPTQSLLARMEAYLLVREMAGLAYVLRNEIDEELSDELQKLKAVLAR